MPETEPAVEVAKLGYVGFQTPDVDRLVSYYTDILEFKLVERPDDHAFLTTGLDHHCVVVEKGGAKARTFVGYEIKGSLDDAQKRLGDRGYRSERRTDIAPGIPEVLVVTEPATGTPLHLYQAQEHSGPPGHTQLRPNKLGHVAAFTADLVALQGFYEELLGFRWSDTIGDFFVFLRCNVDHHAANFLQSSRYQGMHHVAYELRDVNHVVAMADYLAAKGYQLIWGPGRHGPGHNLFTYHRDPDGNIVELFTQLDVIYHEEKGYFEPRPWHEDYPQFPKTWQVDAITANRWGPLNPDMLAH